MISLIFFSTLIISSYLYRNVAGSLSFNKPNVISVLYIFHILLHTYIGAYLISMDYAENSVVNRVSDDTIKVVFFYITYSIFGIYLGIFFMKKIFKIKSAEKLLNVWVNKKPTLLLGKNEKFLIFFLQIISFFCFLSAIYVTYYGGISPLFNFTNFSQYEILTFRTDISRNFGGIYFVKSFIFDVLTPLIGLISYSYFLIIPKSLKIKIWFYLLFVLTIYVLTYNLAKSPLVSYLITMVILKYYTIGNLKINEIFIFLLVALIILFSLFAITSDSDYFFILNYIITRIFIDEVSATFLLFEIFPSIYDHIGFSSISGFLSNLLGLDYSSQASRVAMEYAFEERSALGQMNLLSTYFLGEAWANFGYVGLVFSPIYVGLIISFFYYYTLKKLQKNVFALSILAFYTFGVSISSQFNSYIYNPTFIILILILFSVYKYSKTVVIGLLNERN